MEKIYFTDEDGKLKDADKVLTEAAKESAKKNEQRIADRDDERNQGDDPGRSDQG